MDKGLGRDLVSDTVQRGMGKILLEFLLGAGKIQVEELVRE